MNQPGQQPYLREIARRLRQFEAEKARGDLSKLEELDQLPDIILLRKWAWMCSIVFCGFAFLAMPLIISIFQPFMPEGLNTFVWAFAKTAMATALLLLGTTVYLTIKVSTV